MNIIKKIILHVMIFFLNVVYTFLKLLPVKNKIVLMSRQSNKISLDFSLLGRELEKRHKIVYLCKKLNKDLKSVISYGIHMFRQMYHLATSKICIIDGYCPTVSILHHKKSLTIVQIWHSIGTTKKFGLGILDRKEGGNKEISKIMKQHQNYDVMFASSDAYKHDLAEGFGCDKEKILTYTLPRVDMLFDENYQKNKRNEIFTKYPMLKEKQNILYCPTFRKDEKEAEKAIEKLAKSIDYNKYNLVIKLHPVSKMKLLLDNVIIDQEFSTFEMLSIADKVISDYSCIIYEAGLLNIPIYFYNFDIENYDVVRGVTLDQKELPGYVSADPKELVESLEKTYDMDYLKQFIKKYVTNQKDCTKKMVEKIEEFI